MWSLLLRAGHQVSCGAVELLRAQLLPEHLPAVPLKSVASALPWSLGTWHWAPCAPLPSQSLSLSGTLCLPGLLTHFSGLCPPPPFFLISESEISRPQLVLTLVWQHPSHHFEVLSHMIKCEVSYYPRASGKLVTARGGQFCTGRKAIRTRWVRKPSEPLPCSGQSTRHLHWFSCYV